MDHRLSDSTDLPPFRQGVARQSTKQMRMQGISPLHQATTRDYRVESSSLSCSYRKIVLLFLVGRYIECWFHSKHTYPNANGRTNDGGQTNDDRVTCCPVCIYPDSRRRVDRHWILAKEITRHQDHPFASDQRSYMVVHSAFPYIPLDTYSKPNSG